MKSENTSVSYQKHKSYGYMYYPRQFIYLRHVFPKDDRFYIMDKSIDYQINGGLTVQTGTIDSSITCVMKDPTDSSISNAIICLSMDNGGISNKETDS